MTNNQKLAIEATKRVLDSLANSDFVTHCGDLAIKELRGYQLDIAIDIAEIFEGREAIELEKSLMVEAFEQS